MFSWRCSIHEMAPFLGGFLSPFSHKYGSIFLKFRPEVVSHKAKAVSEQSFKIKCLCGNRTYPKLRDLVHFWAYSTPGKPKVLPKKTKFSRKLHPYDYKSPKSQINHRILIKLIKKVGVGGKNGLFKVKNRLVIKNQEVRGQVSTTFSEAPNSGLNVSENNFVVA